MHVCVFSVGKKMVIQFWYQELLRLRLSFKILWSEVDAGVVRDEKRGGVDRSSCARHRWTVATIYICTPPPFPLNLPNTSPDKELRYRVHTHNPSS